MTAPGAPPGDRGGARRLLDPEETAPHPNSDRVTADIDTIGPEPGAGTDPGDDTAADEETPAGEPEPDADEIRLDRDQVLINAQAEIERIEGRRLAEEWFAAKDGPAWPAPMSFRESLDNPPSDAGWRVHKLTRVRSFMTMVAARKVGKTTLAGCYALAVLSGEMFLGPHGRAVTTPLTGSVLVISFEMQRDQLDTWFRDQGLEPYADRLIVWHLRESANPLATARGRAELTRYIAEFGIELVVLDTFSAAFSGRSENDATEVKRWFADLQQAIKGCDLLVTMHTGWDAERTRGSSALEGRPDVVMTITQDRDGPTRYVSTLGRDCIEYEGAALIFDPDTRLSELDLGALSRKEEREARRDASEGARATAKAAEREGDRRELAAIIRDQDPAKPLNATDLTATCSFSKARVAAARIWLQNEGYIVGSGSRGAPGVRCEMTAEGLVWLKSGDLR